MASDKKGRFSGKEPSYVAGTQAREIKNSLRFGSFACLGLAHEFLDYLLRPQVSADVPQSTKTATANAEGRALLPEAVRTSAVLYPPSNVLGRGEWPITLPPFAQRLRERIWTEIKSA